jgi:hypothetical protein
MIIKIFTIINCCYSKCILKLRGWGEKGVKHNFSDHIKKMQLCVKRCLIVDFKGCSGGERSGMCCNESVMVITLSQFSIIFF